MLEGVSIQNKTKAKLPSLPFLAIKNDILGKAYTLSIAFVTPPQSRRINRTYRGKDNPTNILSFPLTKDSGELILCPSVIKKEAPDFDRTFRDFMLFLTIHGLLHLKGLDHGKKMENLEKKYEVKYTTHTKIKNK